MRLKSVQITEYKSVRDSGKFDVGDVTCLVGKNEAGKTAILQSLYRLNPIITDQGNFSVTNDYPRVDAEDYAQAVESKKRNPATVVTATYDLDDDERAAIEEDFGAGFLVSPSVTLKRGYDNKGTFTLAVDEAAAVRHVIKSVEVSEEIRAHAATLPSLSELNAYLTECAAKQDAAYKASLAAAQTLADAAEKAEAIDLANTLKESATAAQLRTDIGSWLSKSLTQYIWDTYLVHKWPVFLYFDEYYQMEGRVNVQALKQRQTDKALTDSDRPMLGLIDLARLNLDQLLNVSDTQALLNKIEGASNHLSKQILRYWSQNKHILVRFDLRPALPQDPEGMREGMNLWGFVHDTKHLATTQLGTRSRGFIWFFSFLAWFSQQRKLNKPMILLLDEPGLFLHASAQADLLKYIEQELMPHHQVIYSTHSPFMVDAEKFSRVRIVRDKSMEQDDDLPIDQQGTKVFVDVLEADEGSLFPLQGALGYDIAQTLFVGPSCLIVEGVSDLLIIQTISGILERQGREGLRPEWTITPVGGSDKIPTFVALLGSQKRLKLATLVDFQSKDRQQLENLYKKKLLQKKHVRTFAEFVGGVEADIEDMFDVGFYIELVNREYNAELSRSILEADLSVPHPRIIVRLEKFLEANAILTGGFNHYRPARRFSEDALVPPIATLDRFEAAFKALNKLL